MWVRGDDAPGRVREAAFRAAASGDVSAAATNLEGEGQAEGAGAATSTAARTAAGVGEV